MRSGILFCGIFAMSVWKMTIMLRIVTLLLFSLLLRPSLGVAADELQAPSNAVRDPAHALLISITKEGNRLVAAGGHGVIVYSDDSGQTWRQASVPVSGTITAVAFATPDDAWAVGAQGIVLHTTDGGKSWTIQLDGAKADALMVAASQQFVAQDPNNPKAVRVSRRAHILTEDGPDRPFLALLALSSQQAVVFGGDRMCDRTSDGGKTWSDCSLDIDDSISHNLYAVTTVGGKIYLVGEAGAAFQSSDGAATFTPISSPAESTFFGILSSDSSDLLTFGVGGLVYKSSDQAKSWVQSDISTSSDLTSGTVLKSGKVVVISEAGEIFLSSNGGGSFKQLPLNVGMALFDLTQAPNGDVVFVGSDGVRVEKISAFN